MPQTPLALLEFERRVRTCSSDREVEFRAVNESSEVLRFDQSVLWRLDTFSHPQAVAASGLAEVSADSPYQQWLMRLIQALVPDSFTAPRALKLEELPPDLAEEGEDWAAANMLFCPLRAPDGAALGGMMFARGEAFSEGEIAAADWVAQEVGYGLWAWRKERPWIQRFIRSRTGPPAVAAIGVIIVLVSFIPVPLTALAPAEITPLKPVPITSPLDGVVREIVVKPNQAVKAGEVVATLDDTAIRNRLVVAEKALDIARADLQRATYKSFTDDASRMELQVLDARVREKAAETAYLSELLGRLKLTAPQAGIAVFSDPEEWRGKPVQVGERVMMIADPSFVDVTIYVAPEDVVELEVGAAVTVFLHVNPLSSLEARITRASYEALPTPDGKLAYWVRAELQPGNGLPRIGLRGTAKVRAGQVTLAFYLLRKPFAFLRRTLGI